MSVVYSRSARADLREIARYFARVNPDYGIRIVDAIRQQCQQLDRFPKMGRLREELAEDLRSFGVRPYLVFYRETARGIAGVRVLHGRRDVRPEMFGS
jgi:toxin ParE1/3/4